ncbi:MAG: ABC transporter ATP-binding protein [Erysipelotrichaceae bacterium]|nr:ABC transporter ATP-binding protein [Erysipelotrichaceae bacterium]
MAKDSYSLGQVEMKTGGGGRRGGMRAAEKPKNFANAWSMVLKYSHKQLPMIILGISSAIISVILTLFGPDTLKQITNLISAGMKTGNMNLDLIMSLTIRLGVIYLFSAIIIYVESYTMTTYSARLTQQMRNDISRKLNKVPLSRTDSSSFGDLLSRVTNDVDTLNVALDKTIAELVAAVITFAGCTVMMLITDYRLALTALFFAGLGFVAMRYIIKYSQPFFTNRSRFLGMLNGHIEEMYAGHIIVRGFNGEDESEEVFSAINEKLYETNWKSQFLSGLMMPIMELVSNRGYVAVCVLGAYLVAKGEIEFGVVVAFIVYVKMFTMPLTQVAEGTTSLQTAAAAAERIFQLLSEPEMEDESHKIQHIDNVEKADVVFDHVNFGYTPERTIINDFSFTVYPGHHVAIVGPTGAGKTTLVNLLMRFYELNSGSISIGGIKTSDMSRECVHSQFCMVLQDTWLFNGTVRDNLAFGKEYVSDEEIIKACKAVGIHHYIMSLPQGYDTVLTDDANMSVGQRQLMTIARAMITNAPLLILDEATSSVDTRTEQIVQNAMNKLTEGRTSFTIAHRLSTIRDADIILVMKDGDIVETGNHRELLEANGFYAELWNSQFTEGAAI